jgi:hypothetical protein
LLFYQLIIIIRVDVSWPNLEQRGCEKGTSRMATKGKGDQSLTLGCERELKKNTLCGSLIMTRAQKTYDIIAIFL